jgi:hypothetical protein
MTTSRPITHDIAVLSGDIFRILAKAGGTLSTAEILNASSDHLPNSSRRDDADYIRGKLLQAKSVMSEAGILKPTDPETCTLAAGTSSRDRDAVVRSAYDVILKRRKRRDKQEAED